MGADGSRSLSEAPDSTFRRYFTILILQKMTEIQRIEKHWKHWRRSRAQRALHARLKEVDPKSAEEIHAHNVKRVIRALEYFHLTGQPISAHNEEQRQKESPYCFAYFVLNDDRANLYRRIDKRVDQMMDEGLLEEVQLLKDMGYHKKMVSMQGLGYKEMLDHLDGICPLEEAVRILKRDTRHFAKRQLPGSNGNGM